LSAFNNVLVAFHNLQLKQTLPLYYCESVHPLLQHSEACTSYPAAGNTLLPFPQGGEEAAMMGMKENGQVEDL
jgi:hypothetical protein